MRLFCFRARINDGFCFCNLKFCACELNTSPYLRSGEVTVSQMRIALNMGNIHVSQKEFDYLCENFAGRNQGQVNWKRFEDEVEAAFTTKKLEKNIDAPIGAARTQTFYGTKTQKKTNHSAAAHALVSRFRQFIT